MNQRVQDFISLINERLFDNTQKDTLYALWDELTHYTPCHITISSGDRQGQVCGKPSLKDKDTCMCHTPREKKEKPAEEEKPRCGLEVKTGLCIRFCVDGTDRCTFHQPKEEAKPCEFVLLSGKKKGEVCGKDGWKCTTLCHRHSQDTEEVKQQKEEKKAKKEQKEAEKQEKQAKKEAKEAKKQKKEAKKQAKAEKEYTGESQSVDEEKVEAEVKPVEKKIEVEVKSVEKVVAEVKPNEKKVETEVKPIEKKIEAEVKPVEKKIVNESKPIEKKVETEVKPIEKKIKAEVKPVEKKIVNESKPVEKKIEAEVKPFEKKVETEVKAVEKQIEAEVKPVEKKIEVEVKSIEKKIEVEVKPVEKKVVAESKETVVESSQSQADETLCSWIMKAGIKKGKACGKKCNAGQELCVLHM